MNSLEYSYKQKLDFFRSLEFKIDPPEVDLYIFGGEATFRQENGVSTDQLMDIKSRKKREHRRFQTNLTVPLLIPMTNMMMG